MTRDSDGSLTAADLNMPEATGSRRMDWAALPREVTARIEQLLGSPVAHAILIPPGVQLVPMKSSRSWLTSSAWVMKRPCPARGYSL